ncbi:hydrogenase expression/formation C-terminal domain-containing protein [Roseospira goensis]|uniref:Hydrogenase-1 operon protein HyaF n=1 Tax=Roseospira goensis TaxID=391922 RepID=A0A7W6WL54_9PROT|nr:hydrogenase expression/formation C-terminal domain-containing protein [Roseospira goensis]MBB4286454.1 hydrogenase-1 operon protein HyaF [Roseospira goensis]
MPDHLPDAPFAVPAWAAGPTLPAAGPEALGPPAAGHRGHALAAAEALVAAAPEALALVEAMLAALRARATAPAPPPPAVFDLSGVGPAGVTLLDQILGSGEVTGTVQAAGGETVAVRESVLTGVWRLHRRDPDGGTLARWIEIAAVPAVVATTAPGRPAATLTDDAPPAETLVAGPLLAEIADRAAAHTPTAPNHVIALSRLPVTAADLAALRAILGTGPVALRSRGYGTCDIAATGVDRVWSVRFLNASGTVILETLEVGGVPAAAAAAAEDFADAAERLAEIRDAYL